MFDRTDLLWHKLQIAADACADTCRETHFANLFDIQAKVGDVVNMESAVEGLQKGWTWSQPEI